MTTKNRDFQKRSPCFYFCKRIYEYVTIEYNQGSNLKKLIKKWRIVQNKHLEKVKTGRMFSYEILEKGGSCEVNSSIYFKFNFVCRVYCK